MKTALDLYNQLIDVFEQEKFRQCRSRLGRNTLRSALGVVCEVYQENFGDLEIVQDIDTWLYDGLFDTLPEKVQKAFNCDHLGTFGPMSLYELNQLYTFPEIARMMKHVQS